MDYRFSIRWSPQAVEDLEEILDYLKENWTEKETAAFKAKLGDDIELLTKFPFLGAISKLQIDLRKFVLNRHVSIIYKIDGSTVFLVSLFQNSKNQKY